MNFTLTMFGDFVVMDGTTFTVNSAVFISIIVVFLRIFPFFYQREGGEKTHNQRLCVT
ncbi:MAG: hypothetical protein JW795_23780 [Chitinivibrionales bacterium]|nr:hypothetical protein [Chitinivibrionales bacterium]